MALASFKKVGYTGPITADPSQTHPLHYLCRNLHEEENQALTHQLQERVRLLRSLSLEIGAEVRYQSRSLHHLDDDLERADGVLQKTVSRVVRLARGPQHYYLFVIFLFSFACFATVWCLLR